MDDVTLTRYSNASLPDGTFELKDTRTDLLVRISPFYGGEIISLSSKGKELLFKRAAGQDGWRGGAPILFPAVGRQKDGRYTISKGGSLQMPLHGFVMDSGDGSGRPQAFKVVTPAATAATGDEGEAAGASVTMVLDSSSLGTGIDKASVYPFNFSLELTYTLRDGLLMASHTVKRAPAGPGSGPSQVLAEVPMPVAIGNHITFAVPPSSFASTARLAGCTFVNHQLTSENLLSGSTTVVKELQSAGWTPLATDDASSSVSSLLRGGSGLPLSSPVACNAVLGLPDGIDKGSHAEAANAPCAMQLLLPSEGVAIEVSHEVSPITVTEDAAGASSSVAESPSVPVPSPVPAAAAAAGGAGRAGWEEISASRLFVLWGDAREGFICLEPWLTGPDSLNTKRGLPQLYPGEQITWTYAVKVATAVPSHA